MFGWTVNCALTVVNPVFFLFHYLYCIHISIKNHHMFEIISVIRINLSFFFFFVKRERKRLSSVWLDGEPCSYRCEPFIIFFLFHYLFFLHTHIH